MIKSRRMNWVRHEGHMGQNGHSYRILMEKSDGKTPVRGIDQSWEDNIEINVREIGWCVMDWIRLVQHRVLS
jgi:hypothetical protein